MFDCDFINKFFILQAQDTTNIFGENECTENFFTNIDSALVVRNFSENGSKIP
jgi:hypothetical protein